MTTASKSTSRRKSPASSAKADKAAAKPSSRAASGKRSNKTATPEITPEQRRHLIAEAAYLRAEARGFTPGDPVHDWLAAEQEIDARLTGDPGAAIH
ncbi:DUF2934 domain-containing protein [Thiohalobacter thiocyanaticus]|nr:DUF2934 domain-containing protein [Thiohalobacter thiocyanaticus]